MVYKTNDGSDEISLAAGFTCQSSKNSKLCYLPTFNLFDDTPQCYDETDLCKNNDCFQCLGVWEGQDVLNNHQETVIISKNQICDGVINCFDFSDECLCRNNLFDPACRLLSMAKYLQ